MEKLIKKAYDAAGAPPEYKVRLLNDVATLGDAATLDRKDNMLTKPGFWAFIVAILIIAVILYGVWLAGNTTL